MARSPSVRYRRGIGKISLTARCAVGPPVFQGGSSQKCCRGDNHQKLCNQTSTALLFPALAASSTLRAYWYHVVVADRWKCTELHTPAHGMCLVHTTSDVLLYCTSCRKPPASEFGGPRHLRSRFAAPPQDGTRCHGRRGRLPPRPCSPAAPAHPESSRNVSPQSWRTCRPT